MLTVNLAQAKARLSELLDKAEGGEEILITRHGRPAGRLVPAVQPKKPVDLERLQKLRETLPPLDKPSAELIREMRDEGW